MTLYTYGPVNPLNDAIRYTTLAAVKRALGITDNSWDDEATQAIISLETMADIEMNRSFPDTGDNPEINGIPEQIKQFALLGGMFIFKLMDAPGGLAGSDDAGFVGVWEAQETARQAFYKYQAMLKGFHAAGAWGLS